jgi:hypothetical protein
MTARPAALGILARCAFVCLLASTRPPGALAQGQGQQPTRDSAAVKDLPLTSAQRQSYIGRYATELPGGEKVTLRNAPGFVLTFVLLRDYAIRFTLHKPEGDLEAVRIG